MIYCTQTQFYVFMIDRNQKLSFHDVGKAQVRISARKRGCIVKFTQKLVTNKTEVEKNDYPCLTLNSSDWQTDVA